MFARALRRQIGIMAGAALVLLGFSASAQAQPASQSADPTTFVSQISWTSTSPVAGVTLLSGRYSNPAVHPYWTVTIQAPTAFAGTSEEAEAGSPSWAHSTESALVAGGFTPSATDLHWPAYTDDPHGLMGVRVRVGDYATQADANTAAAQLKADGFAPLVEWTGFDATTPDAELVHIAIVNPMTFDGRVFADHGTFIDSRTTALQESATLTSVASTNGGFFTIDAPIVNNVGGVNTGLSVQNGVVESLANGDRAAVVFGAHNQTRILNLTSRAWLRAGDGSSILLLGINRQPGYAEDCGVAGFTPTTEPRQNTVCTGENDIVQFTPQFGTTLPPAPSSGSSLQVIVSPQDRVVSVGTPGGTLPTGDWAVQAIGTDAAWLSSHAPVGARLLADSQVSTAQGRPLRLTPATTVSSAGPLLLQNGHAAIDAVTEGTLDPQDLNDYTFSAYKHARTMIGVRADGDILLATVDGIPGVSEGMTLTEEAALMRSLGATDALNLDGGGSTQFASFGQIIDQPSSNPLRPVGDTIDVVPAS
jgi:hypothetical protein